MDDSDTAVAIRDQHGPVSLVHLVDKAAPSRMLYIMYNMAQRDPANIQRDLSGDLRKADEGTRTPDLLITSELLMPAQSHFLLYT